MNYPPGITNDELDRMERYCRFCDEDKSLCQCAVSTDYDEEVPDPDEAYERMRERDVY